MMVLIIFIVVVVVVVRYSTNSIAFVFVVDT